MNDADAILFWRLPNFWRTNSDIFQTHLTRASGLEDEVPFKQICAWEFARIHSLSDPVRVWLHVSRMMLLDNLEYGTVTLDPRPHSWDGKARLARHTIIVGNSGHFNPVGSSWLPHWLIDPHRTSNKVNPAEFSSNSLLWLKLAGWANGFRSTKSPQIWKARGSWSKGRYIHQEIPQKSRILTRSCCRYDFPLNLRGPGHLGFYIIIQVNLSLKYSWSSFSKWVMVTKKYKTYELRSPKIGDTVHKNGFSSIWQSVHHKSQRNLVFLSSLRHKLNRPSITLFWTSQDDAPAAWTPRCPPFSTPGNRAPGKTPAAPRAEDPAVPCQWR